MKVSLLTEIIHSSSFHDNYVQLPTLEAPRTKEKQDSLSGIRPFLESASCHFCPFVVMLWGRGRYVGNAFFVITQGASLRLKLSDRLAHLVFALSFQIISQRWLRHLPWFVFLQELKTKKSGASLLYGNDPRELLYLRERGSEMRKGQKWREPPKKHLSAGHCG